MTDQDGRLEHTVGGLLLLGGWASTLLLLAGLVVRVVIGPAGASAFLLHVGLLVLMGTPILRVVVSCVSFFRQRDWLLAWTTLSVLVVLAISLMVALNK